MSYQNDRAFADAFLPTIGQIVGRLLLVPTPMELDRSEATDLIILDARDIRIACRIRKPEYLHKYPCQFTIRSRRDSGSETELSKVCAGYGHWLFYGYAGACAPEIAAWSIVDLAQLRYGLQRVHISELRHRGCVGEQTNCDGTHFYWFDIPKLANLCRLDRLLVATNIDALKPFAGKPGRAWEAA